MSLQHYSLPDERDRGRTESWYTRLSRVLEAPATHKRSAVTAFIDEHVRQQFTDGSESVQLQEELLYDVDVDQLFDDFTESVTDASIYVPPSVYGAEQLVVEATAQTLDTAQLAETHHNPTAVTPSFESTVWVSCELGIRARVGNYTDTDVSCRVYIPDGSN